MVKDSEIRKSLVDNDGIWKVLGSAISRVDHKRDEGSFDLRFVIEIYMLMKIKKYSLNLLGLLHNMTFSNHSIVAKSAENIAKIISKYLKEKNSSEMFLRALGIFGNLVSRLEKTKMKF